MQPIIFLILRRIRTPIITLLVVYAISVLGLVLIPGMDDHGKPWHMDFFHAFYFVSFMGSTIGFGEIPYPFTDAQRMWTLVCIYLTVITWLYAIGTLFSLIQQPAFRQAVTRNTFCRDVRRIREPFYLICGYGDTGSLLAKKLTEHDIRATVVEIEQNALNSLELANLRFYTPGLCADANDPRSLIDAGLKSRHCRGVVALTNVDHVNLQIAITSKLQNPDLQVICRSESTDESANMASFGTDFIINPFEIFAEYLATLLRTPALSQLQNILYNGVGSVRSSMSPPSGSWLVCGFGRFGKALQACLYDEDVTITIIESRPDETEAPKNSIAGRGTEAKTLLEANIQDAVGIIAGTDDDANNLSIIMTAKELRPNLFTIARQNNQNNRVNYISADIDMIMQRSEIISRRIVSLIINPLANTFVSMAQMQNQDWANGLIERIRMLVNRGRVHSWTISISEKETPALLNHFAAGNELNIGQLYRRSAQNRQPLPCIPLLHCRGQQYRLLPKDNEKLQLGDSILFCGERVRHRVLWGLESTNNLYYLITGEEYINSRFLQGILGKNKPLSRYIS